MNMPEQKAFTQPKAKGYAGKYQIKGKEIALIGIGFPPQKKRH